MIEFRMGDAVGCLCGGAQAVQVVYLAAEDLSPDTASGDSPFK